jgi:hypothetical protein
MELNGEPWLGKTIKMIIPHNMTEQQLMDEINFVVNKIAPKYTFYGYEINDIKQESFMICMEAMQRYDPTRPLENFLSVHLSNRLKNFVRDNYFSRGEDEKRRIVLPGQLANEQSITGVTESHEEALDYKDMSFILNRKLPANMRADYLRIVNDVYVSKKRKEEVLDEVYEILEEHGYA